VRFRAPLTFVVPQRNAEPSPDGSAAIFFNDENARTLGSASVYCFFFNPPV
jgi:hypothetical protein